MDAGFIPRLLSVINSIDLWVFIAFAFAAYAALFVPSFGGSLRRILDRGAG